MLLDGLEVSVWESCALSGLPTMLSVLVHSHSLKEAMFAVSTWQANDKVSHRGVWEDMGRILGGRCCCPASPYSSALGEQIPQAISDSACGRIKAASFPGFV